MWYDAIAPQQATSDHPCKDRAICYAESSDGLNWERKNVNRFLWQGNSDNNIVMPGSEGGAVMKDPNGPDEHRYKNLVRIWPTDSWLASRDCIAPRWEGKKFIATSMLYMVTSPDGFDWNIAGPVSDYFHDTGNCILYDDTIGKYVGYVRTHTHGRTVGRIAVDDPLNLPWIELGQDHEKAANNFLTVLACDELDPPNTDLYTPCMHKYPWADDAWFSFTTPYRHYPVGDTADTTRQGKDARGRYANDGPVDVQLAVSRNGIDFTRPDRRPYIPLGLDGARDAGQLYMSVGMLRIGDEIIMHYCGTSHTHGAYDPTHPAGKGGLIRLRQRLDGFMSADAAYEGGEFTSPPLTFTGAHLQLNVDCSAIGQVWVELRDKANQPLSGYTLEDAIDVDRNHIAAAVRWKSHEDAGDLIGQP